ncbi:SRPBCC domain-containing protein [Vibrio sp. CJQ_6]|uniref:SRPBCC family protein n=1 Tax=Vibrio sp. CJQ_6 TaxID=3367165 RepID=UPI00370CBE50
MLTLNYQIEIQSDPNQVWQMLTELELYTQWATAFSPQSRFSGEWREGADMKFFDPQLGGTRAVLDTVEPGQSLAYHHVAIFTPEHVQDIDSDMARKWIGSTECYHIIPQAGSVLLRVTVTTHADFVSMFNDGWEKALPMIKLLCEQQTE